VAGGRESRSLIAVMTLIGMQPIGSDADHDQKMVSRPYLKQGTGRWLVDNGRLATGTARAFLICFWLRFMI